MHYLHRILVYLPDVISEEKMKEKELLETIRLYADAETECFYQRAFDWRETDSAGCWSDMYPQQVYLASSDVDWFMNELQQVMLSQRTEIDSCMEQLKSSVGNNLEDIVNGLWKRSSMDDATGGYSIVIINMVVIHINCTRLLISTITGFELLLLQFHLYEP